MYVLLLLQTFRQFFFISLMFVTSIMASKSIPSHYNKWNAIKRDDLVINVIEADPMAGAVRVEC